METDAFKMNIKEEPPLDICLDEEIVAGYSIRYIEPAFAEAQQEVADTSKAGGSEKSPITKRKYTKRKKVKTPKERFQCVYCKRFHKNLSGLKAHLMSVGIKRCDECNYEFPTRLCYVEHRNTVHLASKPLVCLKCPSKPTINTMGKWDVHLRTIHSIFECCQCPMSFPNRSKWKAHIFLHADPALRTCKFCNIITTSIPRLDEHISMVHTIDYTPCTMCDKTFVNKARLHRHMTLRHTGRARRPCDLCGRMIPANGFVKQHVRMYHNPDNQFPCDICFTRYETETNLQRHLTKCKPKQSGLLVNEENLPKKENIIQVHEQMCIIDNDADQRVGFVAQEIEETPMTAMLPEESVFECIYCKATFLSLDKLNKHLRYKQRNYMRCYKCNRCFPSRFCLVRHLNQVHLTDNPLVCSFCPQQTFTKLFSWIVHRRQHHQIFDCSRCELSFDTIKKLNYHKSNHSAVRTCTECNIESNEDYVCDHKVRILSVDMVRCSLCPKLFTNGARLANHFRRTHNNTKRFECDICKRSLAKHYYLKSHMQALHNPEFAFLCNVCHCRFETKVLFERHIDNKKCINYRNWAGVDV